VWKEEQAAEVSREGIRRVLGEAWKKEGGFRGPKGGQLEDLR
jgi:hypothetical protein